MNYPNLMSDYMEGAAPEIIERLTKTNSEKTVGYGTDLYTESASKKIKEACNAPDSKVYFLIGGTQTNAIVLTTMLRTYEGVVSCDTGHIACHEAGAIEALGHKVITVPHVNGKMTAENLKKVFDAYNTDETREHTVKPGAVFISHPTEYGTIYTKSELEAISKVTRENNAYLYVDGARMGYGIEADGADLTLEDFARLTDAFYIGGTKCGCLFGEAVVLNNKNLHEGFFSTIKQRGALLAKGRITALQFDTLFTDNLYNKICRNGVEQAMYLKENLKKKGYDFLIDSPTNQQFPIIETSKIEELRSKVGFSIWEKLDNSRTAIRLVTSFMTTREEIDEVLKVF